MVVIEQHLGLRYPVCENVCLLWKLEDETMCNYETNIALTLGCCKVCIPLAKQVRIHE